MRQVVYNITIKNIVKAACRLVLSVALFFSSVPALSAIPFHNAFEQYELINEETKELNLSLLANIQIMIEQNRFNLGHYIPITNLPMNDDGSVISRRILKQTFQTLSDVESAANAPFLQTANKLNNAIGTEMKTQGQYFTMRVKALETQAEILYRGKVNASLSYDISEQETKFELTKNVGRQVYAYTLTDHHDETINKVGIRWNF